MKRPIKKILILVFLFCLLIYTVLLCYIGTHVYDDNRQHADAILVLGVKSYKDNSYNPCLVSRVDHAVELQKHGWAGTLIFSGGTDQEDHKNEAETMKEIAAKEGIPENKILLETNSTSSYENLVFSQRIMKERGISYVIIVTEPFHAPRVALVAKKLGMQFTISPTTTSPCWTRWKYASRYFLREPFALVSYFIRSRI